MGKCSCLKLGWPLSSFLLGRGCSLSQENLQQNLCERCPLPWDRSKGSAASDPSPGSMWLAVWSSCGLSSCRICSMLWPCGSMAPASHFWAQHAASLLQPVLPLCSQWRSLVIWCLCLQAEPRQCQERPRCCFLGTYFGKVQAVNHVDLALGQGSGQDGFYPLGYCPPSATLSGASRETSSPAPAPEATALCGWAAEGRRSWAESRGQNLQESSPPLCPPPADGRLQAASHSSRLLVGVYWLVHRAGGGRRFSVVGHRLLSKMHSCPEVQ